MSDIELIERVHEKNYTVVDLTCAKDKRLSWGAKGLFLYLKAVAGIPNWKLSYQNLVGLSKDGDRSLKARTKELKTYGYLTIEPIRNEKGRIIGWRWIIDERPHVQNALLDEKPEVRFAHVGNPHVDDAGGSIKDSSNKDKDNTHHQEKGNHKKLSQSQRNDDDETNIVSLPSNSCFQPQWLNGFLLKLPKQERAKVKRLAEGFDHLMLTGGEKNRWVRNPTGFFVDLAGGKVNIKLPQYAPTFEERLEEELRTKREKAEVQEEEDKHRETEKQISDAIAGLEGEELDRFIKAARKRYDFKYRTDRAVAQGTAHRIFLEADGRDWREIFGGI